jgi:hypothetical protein
MSSAIYFASAALVLTLNAQPAVAQQRPSTPEGGMQQPKETPPAPLTGEVLAVDEKAKTFTVKTATEGEVKFTYSDKTVIAGAEKSAQGLVATGNEVTVTYDSHGTAKVATRVEVRPKK